MIFYLLWCVLIMLASAFALIFAFFPLVFVVAIHSFCMYDQEFPIRCVYSTFLLFVNMNYKAPHTLVYGFHPIGDFN